MTTNTQSMSHESVFLFSLGGGEPRTERNNVGEHLRTSDLREMKCFSSQFQETDSEHVTSWTSVGASAVQHKTAD